MSLNPRLSFKISLFIIAFGHVACAQDLPATNPKYKSGMVVCAYPDASKAGLEILKKGGTAVDAAIAVQFALAVTHPQAGNIGGGGFMVYRPANGKANTLDFREKAPAKASADMYLDAAGNVIPKMSLYTHQASGVPGSVDGMVQA
ncbi:gamma-glutamyltransferase, partial [Mucilaginibacter sp. 5C4]